jgi:hypothetical protein
VESPFFTQQKKRTHTETTANQRREATHSRGQIQFRLQDALDLRNKRQLFSPGGVGTAQCPPEEHTSKREIVLTLDQRIKSYLLRINKTLLASPG